mmetsp:Transcript_32909/g.104198  ORF Transcript_32909/g.104198 Transcript_32909/m.104198 type:complete len:206 (-) Transcript_32909:1408-2025(-)
MSSRRAKTGMPCFCRSLLWCFLSSMRLSPLMDGANVSSVWRSLSARPNCRRRKSEFHRDWDSNLACVMALLTASFCSKSTTGAYAASAQSSSFVLTPTLVGSLSSNCFTQNLCRRLTASSSSSWMSSSSMRSRAVLRYVYPCVVSRVTAWRLDSRMTEHATSTTVEPVTPGVPSAPFHSRRLRHKPLMAATIPSHLWSSGSFCEP